MMTDGEYLDRVRSDLHLTAMYLEAAIQADSNGASFVGARLAMRAKARLGVARRTAGEWLARRGTPPPMERRAVDRVMVEAVLS